jgi:hypothetical protein
MPGSGSDDPPLQSSVIKKMPKLNVFNFVHDNKLTPPHIIFQMMNMEKILISYSGLCGITIANEDQCIHKVGTVDTIA